MAGEWVECHYLLCFLAIVAGSTGEEGTGVAGAGKSGGGSHGGGNRGVKTVTAE
jgi:hypothetical protein